MFVTHGATGGGGGGWGFSRDVWVKCAVRPSKNSSFPYPVYDKRPYFTNLKTIPCLGQIREFLPPPPPQPPVRGYSFSLIIIFDKALVLEGGLPHWFN